MTPIKPGIYRVFVSKHFTTEFLLKIVDEPCFSDMGLVALTIGQVGFLAKVSNDIEVDSEMFSFDLVPEDRVADFLLPMIGSEELSRILELCQNGEDREGKLGLFTI